MSKLFLISGLGADERLFSKLDLEAYDVVNVTWIEPGMQDSLQSYAAKLITAFNITAASNVIGVSLGGLLTVEISKQVDLKNAIIISSIKSGVESPRYFKFFRILPIHKLLSGKFLQFSGPLISPLFSKHNDQNESQLFVSMLRDGSPRFLTWAMQAVLDWDGQPSPQKIHHIIGTSDLVFFSKKINDAVIIDGGEHIMVYNRASEISPLIKNILNA